MTNPNYSTDLTDRQWQSIKDLLPAPKPGGRRRTTCLRRALNAMLYLLRSGCQWKLLPGIYPHWRTVYGYFVAWHQDGTWRRLHNRLRRWARRLAKRRVRATAGSVDSQHRLHLDPLLLGLFEGGVEVAAVAPQAAQAMSAVAQARQQQDGACGVRDVGRRDHNGQHQAQGVHDQVALAPADLLARVEATQPLHLRPLHALPPEGAKGFVLLPRRWVVERTFAWLSRWRRIAREYEVKTEHSEALIYLAMSKLMLDRLAPL